MVSASGAVWGSTEAAWAPQVAKEPFQAGLLGLPGHQSGSKYIEKLPIDRHRAAATCYPNIFGSHGPPMGASMGAPMVAPIIPSRPLHYNHQNYKERFGAPAPKVNELAPEP